MPYFINTYYKTEKILYARSHERINVFDMNNTNKTVATAAVSMKQTEEERSVIRL